MLYCRSTIKVFYYVSEISIIQNDGKIQAAGKGDIFEAVFYEAGICGDFEVSEGLILMAEETASGTLKIAVSDPTQKLDSAVIRIYPICSGPNNSGFIRIPPALEFKKEPP